MENILSYKGHPIVRSGDTMYYGSTENKYIIMLKVLETAKEGEVAVAKSVLVELQLTDPEISAVDKVQKSSRRDGLYEALDLASVWLERTLK